MEQMGGGLIIWVVILMGCCFCSSLSSSSYNVGGKDGWRIDPSENYNHWAERNRFQLNDTLIFRYKTGEDSVLVVKKHDYNKCHKSKPLQTLNDAQSGSEFKLDRPGPVFFISGHRDNCEKGEKLSVIVLTPRTKQPSSPSPSPTLPSTLVADSPPLPGTTQLAPPVNSGDLVACSFELLAFVIAMAFGVLH